MARFQLLEISVISAQDLAQVSESVRAYAVAWLHPDRKLTTKIDQDGNTNPTWNEKFVFRIDDDVLNSETSVLMIEIYTATWRHDVLIGSVCVLVSNIVPPDRKPKLRFVALQIRRPSGRPQGILNIGATLLDSTMRSMPLGSELSSSSDGFWDLRESKQNKKNKKANFDDEDHEENIHENNKISKPPTPINDYAFQGNGKREKDYYGYDDEQDSEMGVQKGGFFNEGLICSDVAEAMIGKGLYPMPPPPPPPLTVDNSSVDGWSEVRSTGTQMRMKTKMEKWRTELTPAYEDYNDDERRKLTLYSPRAGKSPRRGGGRGVPYSCFGKMFGLEITISYGDDNRGKRRAGGGKGRLSNSSSQRTFDDSYL